jgi:hypothetical protein
MKCDLLPSFYATKKALVHIQSASVDRRKEGRFF